MNKIFITYYKGHVINRNKNTPSESFQIPRTGYTILRASIVCDGAYLLLHKRKDGVYNGFTVILFTECVKKLALVH